MKENIRVIIVDDEIIAREILETYIAKIPYLELCGSFNNGMDALLFTENTTIDLVLLDIHMPEMNGFTVVNLLSKSTKVILTTAYRSYALQGFEVNAIDYLLKPISYDRFLKAINKFYSNQPELEQSTWSNNNIFVRADRKMQKIALNQIIYIESLSDYVKIHTPQGIIMTRETIRNLEDKLPKNQFLRCHRSYIVALDKMQAYTNEHIEIEQQCIPISRSYKPNVLAFLERL